LKLKRAYESRQARRVYFSLVSILIFYSFLPDFDDSWSPPKVSSTSNIAQNTLEEVTTKYSQPLVDQEMLDDYEAWKKEQNVDQEMLDDYEAWKKEQNVDQEMLATKFKSELSLNSIHQYIYGESCGDYIFWRDTTAEVDYETGKFYIKFPYAPQDVGITSLDYRYYPALDKEKEGFGTYILGPSWNVENYGYNYHNIEHGFLDKKKSQHTLQLNAAITPELRNSYQKAKTKGWTSTSERVYSSKFMTIEIVAHKGKSFPTHLYQEGCYKLELPVLNLYDFRDNSLPRPYTPSIPNNVSLFKTFSVKNFEEELMFLEGRRRIQDLKNRFDKLPSPTEEVLALLLNKYNYNEEKWEDKERSTYYSSSVISKSRKNVVFGLFGNVRDSDFMTLSHIIEILRIVTPNLDVGYSTDPNYVNLPIHLVNCDGYMAQHIIISRTEEETRKCRDNAAGFFSSGDWQHWDNNGWIWVDGQYRDEARSHIIYHEVGHALGLSHNRCYSSSMSYEHYEPFWKELDIMMLRTLYDPIVWDLSYSEAKKWGREGISYRGRDAWKTAFVETYDLDMEKLNNLIKNPHDACAGLQSGWDELMKVMKDQYERR